MRLELQELFDLIRGVSFPFCKGICTYPDRDAEQTKLHEALLELEESGKVERVHVGEGFVTWKPVEEPEFYVPDNSDTTPMLRVFNEPEFLKHGLILQSTPAKKSNPILRILKNREKE